MLMPIIGFTIIFMMLILIFKDKAMPAFCFAILPIIGAFIAGFNIHEISEFINKGIQTTWQTAALFIFSITYFGIMRDVGLFDNMVNSLIKKAKGNITMVLSFTAIIAMIAHIDGAAATTYLITIPAMLPIYKQMNIRPTILLLLCGASTGIMNLVPWGGPTARAAVTAGVDASQLWVTMIPMQIFGLCIVLLMAVYLGRQEKQRIYQQQGLLTDAEEIAQEAEVQNDISAKRPKLFWFNLIFTILLIMLLITAWFPAYVCFMVGTIIVLAVNYPSPKMQQQCIEAHAPSSIMLALTLLCAGIFLGVMTHSGMILGMSTILLNIIPVELQQYLHYIVGALGAPIGMILGPDPYYYGIMPIIGKIVAPYGISMDIVGRAMLIGENVGLSVSPVLPSTFLAIGLAGVELKDHIKFSFLPLWGISLLMMAFAWIISII